MAAVFLAFIQSDMFLLPPLFCRYLIDGAESSSESEMEVDDKSEEEMDTKVKFIFKRLWWKTTFLNLLVV